MKYPNQVAWEAGGVVNPKLMYAHIALLICEGGQGTNIRYLKVPQITPFREHVAAYINMHVKTVSELSRGLHIQLSRVKKKS